MNRSELESFNTYVKFRDYQGNLENLVREYRLDYCGEWNSREDFLEELVRQNKLTVNLSDREELETCLIELFLYDFYGENGYIFKRRIKTTH